MNAPIETPVLPHASKPSNRFADQVTGHPAGALVLAAGLGFASVLVIRALMPAPPPPNRAKQALEDILHRLTKLAQPVYDGAVTLAEDGAHAVGKGINGLGALHLERRFDNLRRTFSGLFH
jgi:hypothetical protein